MNWLTRLLSSAASFVLVSTGLQTGAEAKLTPAPLDNAGPGVGVDPTVAGREPGAAAEDNAEAVAWQRAYEAGTDGLRALLQDNPDSPFAGRAVRALVEEAITMVGSQAAPEPTAGDALAFSLCPPGFPGDSCAPGSLQNLEPGAGPAGGGGGGIGNANPGTDNAGGRPSDRRPESNLGLSATQSGGLGYGP